MSGFPLRAVALGPDRSPGFVLKMVALALGKEDIFQLELIQEPDRYSVQIISSHVGKNSTVGNVSAGVRQRKPQIVLKRHQIPAAGTDVCTTRAPTRRVGPGLTKALETESANALWMADVMDGLPSAMSRGRSSPSRASSDRRWRG
jgi:hypothetical protein